MILQDTPLGARYCMDCCVGADGVGEGWASHGLARANDIPNW